MSHQPCRNSIIVETSASQSPLNSAEYGFKREAEQDRGSLS